MRKEHDLDQLRRAYETLRHAPESRQVVLQIWKPSIDMPEQDGAPATPDVPCNVCSMLKVRDGQLHWTQIMRSNDLVLGLPHNLVQWTTLQEIMAGCLGLEVGSYTHFSDSLHIYEKDWPLLEQPAPDPTSPKGPANQDVLALPYDEFHCVLSTIEERADLMRSPDLSRSALIKTAFLGVEPAAYQNMLFVLGADTARRRGWDEETQCLMSQCTNPVFSFLWDSWRLRQLKT